MILAISDANTIYFRHLAIAVSWNSILLFEKSLAFIRFFIVTLFINFLYWQIFFEITSKCVSIMQFFPVRSILIRK